MTIWFTADIHYNHTNILKYCNRPFFTVVEMDNTIISNWNSVVSNRDTTYILGDITLGRRNVFEKFFDAIHGKKIIVYGGHDKRWMDDYKTSLRWKFDTISYNRVWDNLLEIKIADKTIVLCHYPMEAWEKSHYGSYHLHGHSHGKSTLRENRLDVGMDCHNFFPISFEQVEKLIQRNNKLILDKTD